MIRLLLLFTVIILYSGIAAADTIQAQLPFTPNIKEQWMVVSWGDKIEFAPASRFDSKEKTTIAADTTILNYDRLEAAILIQDDLSLISTPLDRGDIAWQSAEERAEKIAKLAEEIESRRINIRKLESDFAAAQELARVKIGMGELSEIYQKIQALDQEIAKLK